MLIGGCEWRREVEEKMKKRSLKQLQDLYRFSEKRAKAAESKFKYRASGLWNLQRLDILDIAVRDGEQTYTYEEFYSTANN